MTTFSMVSFATKLSSFLFLFCKQRTLIFFSLLGVKSSFESHKIKTMAFWYGELAFYNIIM